MHIVYTACEYSRYSLLPAARDVGETSLAAKSNEKRLYSQASLYIISDVTFRWREASDELKYVCARRLVKLIRRAY